MVIFILGWVLIILGICSFIITFILHLILGKNNNSRILGWGDNDNKKDYKKAFWYMFYFLSICIIVLGIILNYGNVRL